MGLLSSSGKRGGKEPARYIAGATEVTCPLCSNNLFRYGKAQLNTAAMSLFNLDWADRSAFTLVCSQCSFIVWLFEQPSSVE